MSFPSIFKYPLQGLLLCLLLNCNAFAQGNRPPEWLNKMVKVSSETHDNAGTLCMVDFPNKNQWIAVAGYANKAQNVPAIANYSFEIGSMTKMFIATAILQLHEQGLLDINKPISKYIDEPWVKNLNRFNKKDWSDSISIRSVMNHTAGIYDYLDDGSDEATIEKYGYQGRLKISPREIIRTSNTRGSYGPPNKKWRYSNTGYQALGILIEKVSGQNYQQYIRTHILQPANLTQTYFGTNMTEQQAKTKMQGYFNGQKIQMSFYLAGAAGEIVSTMPDMVKFIRAWWQGDFFSKAETTQLLRNSSFVGTGSIGQYGLANMHLFNIYGHSGQTFGFNAFAGIIPEKNIVVIWVSNDSQASAYSPVINIADKLDPQDKH
ncbi:serine hydrolase domain-containing protein [Persicobacter psychrovividus]|uniref:Beta-lactamase-related domain-containing protein n=1 Tax=Persicobacter psychrovividus TaxID=387638 RepID=A0ABM7VAN1_9BACT|nr:hypothetical protein PEPS_02580 [Persicobacter psychrovividus]